MDRQHSAQSRATWPLLSGMPFSHAPCMWINVLAVVTAINAVSLPLFAGTFYSAPSISPVCTASSAQLSPDGKYLAYVGPSKGSSVYNVFIKQLPPASRFASLAGKHQGLFEAEGTAGDKQVTFDNKRGVTCEKRFCTGRCSCVAKVAESAWRSVTTLKGQGAASVWQWPHSSRLRNA